jgi:hypothetical protein
MHEPCSAALRYPALELGRILDLVQGLAKYQPEQAVLIAEVLRDQPVLG